MKVSVKGARDRKLSNLLRKAFMFYATELMHTNLVKGLRINILLHNKCKEYPDKGSCIWDDDWNSKRPREFTITMARGQPQHDKLCTLAHEMVHVKQYAKGEMDGVISKDGFQKWTGGEFKLNPRVTPAKANNGIVTSKYDYYYLPWEIEAYGLEVGLTWYFKTKYGIK